MVKKSKCSVLAQNLLNYFGKLCLLPYADTLTSRVRRERDPMTSASSPLFRRLLSFVVALLILVLAVVVFRGLVASKPQAPENPLRERVWTVDVLSAAPQPMAPVVTLYGRIEAPRSSELSAAVTAFVDELHVDEGNYVKIGEPLLTLDPRDAQLIVERRQAELGDIEARISAELTRYRSDLKALEIEKQLLQLSQRAVERFRALKGRNVGTDSQLEDAQRAYQQQALSLNTRQWNINDHGNRLSQLEALRDQARAQLQAAELDLQRTRILAPFSGRIARVSVAPGDRVRSGDPLLMMYNSDALEVRAQIPSRYLNSVRQALAAEQPLTAVARLDGKPLQLRLHRLSGEVGSGRAGVDGLLRISAGGAHLELGRSLELDLQLPAIDDLLALPPQALYGTDRVYRVEDNRLQAISIQRLGEVTIDGEPRILVNSPQIEAGDQIITTQLPNAITGLKVKLVGG